MNQKKSSHVWDTAGVSLPAAGTETTSPPAEANREWGKYSRCPQVLIPRTISAWIGLFLLIPLLLLYTPVQAASVLDGWQWEQDGRFDFATINTQDSPTLTPYPAEGNQQFVDVGFRARRRSSLYERERFHAFGVLNDSEYRQDDNEFILEQMTYFRESGSVALPYRLTAGDFFGNFSHRTLQRSLQGLSVEVQPGPVRGFNQSVQLINGSILSNDWRDLDDYDGSVHGLSWLLQSENQALNLNYIHNRLRDDAVTGLAERNQDVLGLASFHRILDTDDQRFTLETEVDWFTGDHRGFGGVQDKDAQSYYARLLGGSDRDWTYRFQFEDNSRHYRPAGVVVTPDRRSYELQVNRLLPDQRALQVNFQELEENESTGNPLGFSMGELILTGNVLPEYGATGRSSVRYQDRENLSRTIDEKTWTLESSLRWPLREGNQLVTAAFLRDRESDTTGVNLDETFQARLGLEMDLEAGGWEGLFRPEVVYRQSQFPSRSSDEWNPVLNLDMHYSTHHFTVDWDYLDQDRTGVGADVTTRQGGVRYTNRMAPGQTLGWEMEQYRRHRNGDGSGSSTVARIFYEWTTSGVVEREPEERRGVPTFPSAAGEPLEFLVELRNIPVEEALRRLWDRGLAPEKQGSFYVADGQFLNEFLGRQRMVLKAEEGRVQSTGLVLNFRRVDGASHIREALNRIVDLLIGRLGPQDVYRTLGELAGDVPQKISRGIVQRLHQWEFREHVVRFGIPARLDGQIRMELRIADQLPSVQQTNWSLESIK